MSDQNTDESDKSHEPTPQKIKKSREQGDVAYSTEATSAATYLAFFVALLVASGWIMTRLQNLMIQFLAHPDDIGAQVLWSGDGGFLTHVGGQIGVATAPIFGMLMVATLISVISQQAVAVAPSKIKPKWSRISIIKNAKKKYGWNGFVEFLKSATKLSAVLLILLFAYKDRFAELPSYAALPASAIAPLLFQEAAFFCGLVVIVAVAIAAIDMPWQHFQHRKRLKMTFQELREEHKDTEGDPHLKGARRQRAESIATNRMMNDVPDADIIIVNPTHYAVALKWERGKQAAPVCVAKGVDAVAARIREAAAVAGVPIKRDPPTARSIYAVVDIGEEIRKEHYAAVAAAIHYAEEMRKKWQVEDLT